MPNEFAAQEGSGIGQLEDLGGDEPFEYPPQGLRNDQGGMFILTVRHHV